MMREGPIDIVERQIDKPKTPDFTPFVDNSAIPSRDRLQSSAQWVTLKNHDPQQTHIVIDQGMQGHELRPGQSKKILMLASEIKSYQEWARPDRGVYMSGRFAGQPLPQHPVRITDISEP